MFPALSPGRYLLGVLPWYSVMIITGILLAIILCEREEKRLGLPADTVIDLALRLVPCGVVGARLYYVAFSWEAFADNPLSILYVWQGGLAIYGGVIGGLIAVVVFAWRRKLPPLLLTDMIVPTLALAQAIGRWGNYFNMEAYGAEITDPAWQFFPAGVLIPEGGAYVWHMATFFYESMWNLTVFLILWFVIRRRKQRHGVVTLWYALLYGTGRFLIEGLRTDSLMSGSLRVSQVLSAALALGAACALTALVILKHRKKMEAA
ncbi:MAG: prolipoprotein diacylglyceryl transferase [Clostridia bacterium]|nr:prolipoprotein diacylglyceryl transferase [Clostridia bacterium]